MVGAGLFNSFYKDGVWVFSQCDSNRGNWVWVRLSLSEKEMVRIIALLLSADARSRIFTANVFKIRI